MGNRISYLDVAKFIGIFCIYLGHFAFDAGYAYEFVFAFHVPLFFFLSGCTEALGSNIPWYKYILKNVKNILVPFYIFALISIAIQSICYNTSELIVPNLLILAKGCIRNQFFAGSLWFLSCLFIIKIVFYFLRRLLKFKALLLLVCFGLYCVFALLVPTYPSMPYNVDSVCYYIIFYALGYCFFEPIRSFLDLDTPLKKGICAVLGLLAFIYAAFLFFGKKLLYINVDNVIVSFINFVVPSLVIILLVLIVSRLLENVTLFVNLGKNTLYMCGSEYVVKLLAQSCLQAVGLNILLINPMVAHLYTFALLVLCNKTVVPIEKAFFRKLRLIK